jgi:hypothetical protein
MEPKIPASNAHSNESFNMDEKKGMVGTTQALPRALCMKIELTAKDGDIPFCITGHTHLRCGSGSPGG